MKSQKSSSPVASVPHLRRVGILLVLASLLAIGFATLLPEDGRPIPSFCVICGTVGGVDAILNVLLFVPLGVGLALSNAREKVAIPAMALLSLFIELAQLIAIPGRDASLGDLLTNTVGGALGFILCRNATGWLRPSARTATKLAIGWFGLWLGIQSAASFGFSRALPSSQYYGQIARPLEIFAKFEGKVLSPKVGHQDVHDWGFSNSAQVQQDLNEGEPVIGGVLPSQPTQDLAPIIRVVDDQKREIVMLAQDRRSLVFGVRTGAAVLRLRQPLFALRGVFPDSGFRAASSMNDTLELEARYAATKVELRGRESSRSIAHTFRIGPALGWTLIAPTQWYIDGRPVELLLTYLWSFALVLPLGYWTSHAIRLRRELPRVRTVSLLMAITIGALTMGLVVVPQAFGLSRAVFGDWLVVIAGVASGWLLGHPMAVGAPTRPHDRGDDYIVP
jgi:hypothetical protein